MVAEKTCSKSFGTECAPPTTWFDFELDTLNLDWGVHDVRDEERDSVAFNFGFGDLSEDFMKVQNLALYSGEYLDVIRAEEMINHVLSRFGNVRKLTMVGPRYSEDDCSNLVFLDHSDANDCPEYSMPKAPVTTLFFGTYFLIWKLNIITMVSRRVQSGFGTT